MTIASAIVNKQLQVVACYTAISNKGGTLPATQDVENMPTAITSIPSGGVGIPREVKNGVYQMPTENFTFSLPSDATDVGNNGLYYAFNGCTSLTNVNLSSLTSVSGSSGLYYAFNGCRSLTNVNLSSLTSVSGSSGLSYAFNDCTSLTNIDLSSLTSVSGANGLSYAFRNCTSLTSVNLSSLTVLGSSGLSYAFRNCTSLTNVNLSSLTSVSGSNGLSYAFWSCKALTSISFPSLTTTSFGSYTNQFSNMLTDTGTTTTHTLHFPSNLENTIQGLSGYPLFGGTTNHVVLAFDLPATS